MRPSRVPRISLPDVMAMVDQLLQACASPPEDKSRRLERRNFKDESWLRGPSRDGQRGQASSSDLEPGLGSPANSLEEDPEALW